MRCRKFRLSELALDTSRIVVATEDSAVEGRGDSRWRSAARQLVDARVTQKGVDVVALVLAEHEAGTAPSTNGRRVGCAPGRGGSHILARALR
jgi:hypothetical protein